MLLLTHILLLPSNYGVLCHSTRYPCVEVFTSEEGRTAPIGYLMSDLTVAGAAVVVLHWDQDDARWALDFFDRTKVKSVASEPCPVPNMVTARVQTE